MKKPTQAQTATGTAKAARPAATPSTPRGPRREWSIRLDLRPPHKSTVPLGCDGGGCGGCA
jgi:hypothetical protein